MDLTFRFRRRGGGRAARGRRRSGKAFSPTTTHSTSGQKAIYALLDEDRRSLFQEYEKEGRLDGWLDYRWTDEHTGMTRITLTGGYVRGDHAVVLFDGSNGYIDHLHGEALLRREDGAWRIHRDMVSVGSR